MTLAELIKRLKALKAKGYIKSRRKGDTGIGHTCEYELGLKESNIPMPDIGGRVELKTTRNSSKSLNTLFTFNRGVWKLKPREMIKKYGYMDEQDRWAYYNTIWSGKVNSQGLTLFINENEKTVGIQSHKSAEIIASWSIYTLLAKFMTKFERLLFVKADSKMSDGGVEFFHFVEAYYIENPTAAAFLESFRNGIIGVDVRMHLRPNGTVRNHGTGFRIFEIEFQSLFSSRRKLL